MSISLKILKLQELDKKLIKNICNLKRTFWKFSLNSHLKWFKNFVKKMMYTFYSIIKKF